MTKMTENTKFQDPDRDIDSKPLALRARGFQTLKLALRARYRQSWHVAHTCVVFCVFLCCALQIFEVQTQKQCLFGIFVDSSEFQ